jgi:hypothetical protein
MQSLPPDAPDERRDREGFDRSRPFDRREAIELREISFGLFDGIADEDLPDLFPLGIRAL